LKFLYFIIPASRYWADLWDSVISGGWRVAEPAPVPLWPTDWSLVSSKRFRSSVTVSLCSISKIRKNYVAYVKNNVLHFRNSAVSVHSVMRTWHRNGNGATEWQCRHGLWKRLRMNGNVILETRNDAVTHGNPDVW